MAPAVGWDGGLNYSKSCNHLRKDFRSIVSGMGERLLVLLLLEELSPTTKVVVEKDGDRQSSLCICCKCLKLLLNSIAPV